MATETEPVAIGDPVARREVRIQRLKIATQVCAESGDSAALLRTLLVGAEAMKSDDAIFGLVVRYPDLSAAFMRESATKLLLLDAAQIENHGPLLFHLMLEDARSGNAVAAREEYRQLRAWLERRRAALSESQKESHRTGEDWTIDARDIAAEIEAVLRIRGVDAALDTLKRWRPKARIALGVARILVPRLIISGAADAVEQYLASNRIKPPWDLVLLVPLALSGQSVDVARIQRSLGKIRRRWIRLERISNGREDDTYSFWLDIILTACEIVVARRGNRRLVTRLLVPFADKQFRNPELLNQSQTALLDVTLRATALLRWLRGQTFKLDDYLGKRRAPKRHAAKPQPGAAEKRERIEQFLRPLIEIYAGRGQILTGRKAGDSSGALREGFGSLRYHDYYFSGMYGSAQMRRRVAIALATLVCVPEMNLTSLLSTCLEVFGERCDPMGSDEIAVASVFGLNNSSHSKIMEVLNKRAQQIIRIKTVAREKIDALLDMSRFVAQVSQDDARGLFNEAHRITEELDTEAIYQIRTIAAMAVRATSAIDPGKRRQVAENIRSFITDAAIRLSGEDHFPWAHSVESIAALDLPLAMAATARWQDADLVRLDSSIPTLIGVGLRNQIFSAAECSAFLNLFAFAETTLIKGIADTIGVLPAVERVKIIDELARQELFRLRPRQEVFESLKVNGANAGRGPWYDSLETTITFIRNEEPPVVDNEPSSPSWAALKVLPSGDIRYQTSGEIEASLKAYLESARASGGYGSTDTFFDHILGIVSVGSRRLYLNALAELSSTETSDYEVAEAICKAVKTWHSSPGVQDWCRQDLAGVIIARLPGFARNLHFRGSASLRILLQALQSSGRSVSDTLAVAIGKHVDELSVDILYDLIQCASEWIAPEDNGIALAQYTLRLVSRIPTEERDLISLEDLPIAQAEATARFLYALMSDCDVRIRWRVAHAVRALAQLGHSDTIDSLVALYPVQVENVYRMAGAPFYWLAARQWLIMTLDRIAEASPGTISRHGAQLLALATDDTFPHVVIRHFAREAVLKLRSKRMMKITPRDVRRLNRSISGGVPRERGPRSYPEGKGLEEPKELERRFHFSSMDTIPYWYQPVIRTFADVTQNEFLNTAESWIVDRWKVQSDVSKWIKEPRQHRFSYPDSVRSTNDHGSMPTLERYATYLEWHAMCCTIGELMQTRPLIQMEDDWYTLEGHSERWALTRPPFWLADLRCPKPLERKFWYRATGTEQTWPMPPVDTEFYSELGLGLKGTDKIIVKAWHDTASLSYRCEIAVNSAFVDPKTSLSLLRALQTVKDRYDYRVPVFGDDLEIDDPPYRFLGWLVNSERDFGVDEQDPMRNTIRGNRPTPGKLAEVELICEREATGHVTWRTPNQPNAFEYETWSDRRNDQRDERYTSEIESEGYRLWASAREISKRLVSLKLDLLVEITITRDRGYSDYRQYEQDKEKRIQATKVLLLRSDGTLESVEGRLGTWYSPSS